MLSSDAGCHESMAGPVYITEGLKQGSVKYEVYLSELRHGRTRGALNAIVPDRSGGQGDANVRLLQGPGGRGYGWAWDWACRSWIGQGP